MDEMFKIMWLAGGMLLLQAVIILAAVALGGWLVFRTKRDAHERLFASAPKKEAVAQSYLDGDGATSNTVEDIVDPVEEMMGRYEARAQAAILKTED